MQIFEASANTYIGGYLPGLSNRQEAAIAEDVGEWHYHIPRSKSSNALR
jgi:hypothetical protein